jgi:ABC-type lipoprotein export system ATPase subunit
MIELKNVSKQYISRKGVVTQALDNISLRFPSQGLVFILGKSGSGKSTLMNILGGLDTVSSGDFIINGENIAKYSQVDLDHYRNAHVGFVFQDFNIIETFSVYENISLALELQGQAVKTQKLDQMLEFVGLSGLGRRKGNEVSGGQKQRIAVARALIKEPKIILADEPTGNLDSQTSKQIMELIKEVSRTNLVIMVSHDSDEANQYADRIIRIKDGRIFEDTAPMVSEEEGDSIAMVKQHLGFFSSFKYGLHALSKKKGQLLITTFVISLAMMFSYLLGAYLMYLQQPDPSLAQIYGADLLARLTRDLLGYLPQSSAFNLLLAIYVILVAIVYVFLSLSIETRMKQIGIFKALGGNTRDILLIFVWEGILLALFTWGFGSWLGYIYALDINLKFFQGIDILRVVNTQVSLNLVLMLTLGVGYTIVLVQGILRKNAIIAILKK